MAVQQSPRTTRFHDRGNGKEDEMDMDVSGKRGDASPAEARPRPGPQAPNGVQPMPEAAVAAAGGCLGQARFMPRKHLVQAQRTGAARAAGAPDAARGTRVAPGTVAKPP